MYNYFGENILQKASISKEKILPLDATRAFTVIRYLFNHLLEDPLRLGLETNSRGFHEVNRLTLSSIESVTSLQIDLAERNEGGLVVDLVADVAAKEGDDADVI